MKISKKFIALITSTVLLATSFSMLFTSAQTIEQSSFYNVDNWVLKSSETTKGTVSVGTNDLNVTGGASGYACYYYNNAGITTENAYLFNEIGFSVKCGSVPKSSNTFMLIIGGDVAVKYSGLKIYSDGTTYKAQVCPDGAWGATSTLSNFDFTDYVSVKIKYTYSGSAYTKAVITLTQAKNSATATITVNNTLAPCLSLGARSNLSTTYTDFSFDYTEIKESLAVTHSTYINDCVTSGEIDRSSEAYKTFIADYNSRPKADRLAFVTDASCADFINLAKLTFGSYVTDDFSDLLYTDVSWKGLTSTGGECAEVSSKQSYNTNDSAISFANMETATYYGFKLPSNMGDLTLDVIPQAAGEVLILPFINENYKSYIKLNNSENGFASNIQWQTMKTDGVTQVANTNSCFWNLPGNLSGGTVDFSEFFNTKKGATYSIVLSYSVSASDTIVINATLFDNDQKKVSVESSYDTKIPSSEEGSFAFAKQTSMKCIFDNVCTYQTDSDESKALDFKVDYANELAYSNSAITPTKAFDIAIMQSDFTSQAVNLDAMNKIDPRYSELVSNTAVATWNSCTTTEQYAAAYRQLFVDATKNLSALTEQQVKDAWSVLNSLDKDVKLLLAAEQTALKSKLSAYTSVEGSDTVKISFIGDSQTISGGEGGVSGQNTSFPNYVINSLNSKNDGNAYEFINLGISGYPLTSGNDNTRKRSQHERNSYWNINSGYSPDIVFIDLGTNDNTVTDEVFGKTLTRMVKLIQSFDSAPLVVLVSPYSNGYDNVNHSETGREAKVAQVRDIVMAVQDKTGCAFIDLYEYTYNWTTSEKDYYYAISTGATDGLHPASVGREKVASYIVNNFFDKLTTDFATEDIRSYDFSYADNCEKYLGYSYYDLETKPSKTEYEAMFADVKDELISESIPQFQAVSSGLKIDGENADGQLSYALKYSNSVFEAFGMDYKYGVAVLPTQAIPAGETLKVDTASTVEKVNVIKAESTNSAAKNVYVILNGSQSDKLKGVKISAVPYVAYKNSNGDYVYIYGEQKDNSVKMVRRSYAVKMITLASQGFTKQQLSYQDAQSASFFEGYDTPTNDTYSTLTTAINDKTIDSEKVYNFIKYNFAAFQSR